MQLSNVAGEAFELTLVGYQFPDIRNEKYDANWLQVRITATHLGRTWGFESPCLLTWEVAHLRQWLAKVGARAPIKPTCEFLEPVLSFALHTDVLRISLALEGRPPWAKEEVAVWLDFPVHEIDFARVEQSLAAQLARYPERVSECD